MNDLSVPPNLIEPPVTRSLTLTTGGSLLVGGLLALVLVIGPAAGAVESIITGCVLLAFGVGWALLWLSSVRFTAQPQRWAMVPAAYLGIVGLALVVARPSTEAIGLLSWLWPPAVLALAIWMGMQVRRGVRGGSRWLLYPVVALLGLSAIGGLFQTVSEALDRANELVLGQLVDVGGHRLHINCTGTGAPTVVFESGLAEGAPYWGHIAPVVSETTHVCIYDRAGRGLSESASGPQDGDAVATDLRSLLANSGNPGPYVLVGHSTGGPYVRAFAARYPEDVAGMVFLDSQPADAFGALPTFPAFYRGIRVGAALFPPAARIGLFRLANIMIPADLPSPYRELENADQSSPRLQSAQRDEFAVLPQTLTEAQALTSLGTRPLVVVTAVKDAQAGWLAAQDRLPGLSANSSHRIATDQSHASLILSELGAVLSVQAVLDVVASVRTGVPLTR